MNFWRHLMLPGNPNRNNGDLFCTKSDGKIWNKNLLKCSNSQSKLFETLPICL